MQKMRFISLFLGLLLLTVTVTVYMGVCNGRNDSATSIADSVEGVWTNSGVHLRIEKATNPYLGLYNIVMIKNGTSEVFMLGEIMGNVVELWIDDRENALWLLSYDGENDALIMSASDGYEERRVLIRE